MAAKKPVNLPAPPVEEEVEALKADPEAQTENKNAIVQFVEILEMGILDRGNLETGEYTTRRGIKLQAQRPNDLLIQKAVQRFKPPEIPMIFDEDRQEEVPWEGDPDYQQELAMHNAEVMLLVVDIYLSHTLVLECPDGIVPPASEEWESDVTMFGIEVPKFGRARMSAWLNYYALDTSDEVKEYASFLQLYNYHIKEEDVRDKVNSFRNPETPNTDSGLRDKAES